MTAKEIAEKINKLLAAAHEAGIYIVAGELCSSDEISEAYTDNAKIIVLD